MFRIPIVMPQLGESIAEATIVQLLVPAGSSVKGGEELFEVETNKAIMSVTAPCAGTLTDIAAEANQSYAVGSILAHMDVTEEEANKAGIETDPHPPRRQTAPVTVKAPQKPEEEANLHFAVDTRDALAQLPAVVEPVVRGLTVPARAAGARYLSPRMRARMEELGMNDADLAAVPGSGAAGRVTVEDFEHFIENLQSQKLTPASPMRIAVAHSMRRSWTRPLATVGINVTLDTLLGHRKKQEPKPGLALYCLRALALALAENTSVAGRLIGEQIVHPKAIDIGFAVEVEDGVLVPVMRDVDQRPLATLVDEYNSLVAQARDRKLPRAAMGGGAATITNFGTFGIIWATPIPLPEQNLVFGVGMGRKVPRWNETTAQFEPATEAELTLSFDHRILDGGGAGRLLHRVAWFLEHPENL